MCNPRGFFDSRQFCGAAARKNAAAHVPDLAVKNACRARPHRAAAKKTFALGDHFWPNLTMLPNCERNSSAAFDPDPPFFRRVFCFGFFMTAKKKTVRKKSARKTTRAKDPRKEIKVRAIIDALEQHVLGEKKMTATQVGAALALLKKTLPDMTAQGIAPTAAQSEVLKRDIAAHEDALGALE